MPRGSAPGERRGGRRKGTPNRRTLAQKEELENSGLSPLDYMLSVMRDPEASPERRDYNARGAAPYCHRALKAIEHTGEGGGPIEHKVTLSFD
jgi:hypothetical protein